MPGLPSAHPSRVASAARATASRSSPGVLLRSKRWWRSWPRIEAAAFSADLTDQAAALAAVDAIRARFGRIDTLYYAPAGDVGFVPARALARSDR